jgi:hypothetical protein
VSCGLVAPVEAATRLFDVSTENRDSSEDFKRLVLAVRSLRLRLKEVSVAVALVSPEGSLALLVTAEAVAVDGSTPAVVEAVEPVEPVERIGFVEPGVFAGIAPGCNEEPAPIAESQSVSAVALASQSTSSLVVITPTLASVPPESVHAFS